MNIIDINGNKRECAEAYPDKDYPGYMRVEFKTGVRSHHEWYPIDEFIKNNPNLKKMTIDAPRVIEETLGIVSSSNKNELTDKKQKWELNIYVGFPVWISRGLGEGQVRTITTNTSNTLVIDKPWKISPNKTSQYVISHNIHDPQIRGNTLPEMDIINRIKK